MLTVWPEVDHAVVVAIADTTSRSSTCAPSFSMHWGFRSPRPRSRNLRVATTMVGRPLTVWSRRRSARRSSVARAAADSPHDLDRRSGVLGSEESRELGAGVYLGACSRSFDDPRERLEPVNLRTRGGSRRERLEALGSLIGGQEPGPREGRRKRLADPACGVGVASAHVSEHTTHPLMSSLRLLPKRLPDGLKSEFKPPRPLGFSSSAHTRDARNRAATRRPTASRSNAPGGRPSAVKVAPTTSSSRAIWSR